MQNSIWKLTALAGVIGIGFLIILQAQQGIDREGQLSQPQTVNDPNDALLAGRSPLESSTSAAPEPPAGLWTSTADGQSEPSPFGQSEPGSNFGPTPGRDAHLFPNDLASSQPGAGQGVQLTGSTEPEARLSPRLRAMKLMVEARDAITLRDLELARAKAVEANEIPVLWDAAEERPADLLLLIDDLLAKAAQPAPAELSPAGSEAPTTLPEFGTGLSDQPFQPAEPLPSTEPSAGNLPVLESPEDPVPQPFESADQPLDPVLETEPAQPEMTEPDTATAEPLSAVRTSVESLQSPELTIEKIAPAEATIGKAMIYQIVINNRGEAAASQVVVEDHVPKGARLVGTSPQAELIGSKLLWRLGALPAGEHRIIKVKVLPVQEGEIGSVATVSFVSEVESKTEVRQPTQAILKLEVTGPERVSVGENVTFKFKVTNEGTRDALNVQLQDIMTVGFEYSEGRDITNPIGNIAVGQAFETELEVKAVEPGRQTNKVIITADGGLRAEAQAAVDVLKQTVVDNQLKLETGKLRPQTVGARVVHRIRVTNESPRAVTGATVILVLPQELKFAAASAAGQYGEQTRTIRWRLPALPARESFEVDATLIPATFGVHQCLAQLVLGGQQLQQSEMQFEATGVASLKLDLDNLPATVMPGEEFTVHVTIANRGNGPDENVTLTLNVPDELEFLNSRGPVRHQTPQAFSRESGLRGKRVPFATIPAIGENAKSEFQITLRARLAGRPRLRAEISSSQLDEPLGEEAAVVVLETSP